MPDSVKTILTAALLATTLVLAGCTKETSTNISTGGPTGASPEPTPSASASSTTGMETKMETTAETGTLEGGPDDTPDVVLRVEGDSGVTFSGLCEIGAEDAVLDGGEVPERYLFTTRGKRLSCRIQKQDSGDGDLKVTLLAEGSTHSVQQINSPDGVINVSYHGGK